MGWKGGCVCGWVRSKRWMGWWDGGVCVCINARLCVDGGEGKDVELSWHKSLKTLIDATSMLSSQGILLYLIVGEVVIVVVKTHR